MEMYEIYMEFIWKYMEIYGNYMEIYGNNENIQLLSDIFRPDIGM